MWNCRVVAGIAVAMVMGGCATGQRGSCPSGAATAVLSHYRAPDQPAAYGRAEIADAGFLSVAVDTQRCGKGILGVKVRLSNTGHKPFETHDAKISARGSQGEVHQTTQAPYDSPCKRGADPRQLQPGDVATKWRFYELDQPTLQVRVELVEPDGLARYDAVFHLDRERAERTPVVRERPPAEASRIALVDDDYFRLAVLRKRACATDDGKVSVGYEVLLESFTNVPLRLSGTKLEDGKGHRYEPGRVPMDGCASVDWGPRFGYDEVRPGEKRRGWIDSIVVGAGSKTLSMRGAVTGMALRGRDFAVSVGARPEADPPKRAVAAAARPTSAAKSTAPARRGDVFQGLEPIPRDPTKYQAAKYLHLVKDHHVVQGNFVMGIVPTTPQLWAAGFYPQWKEKRYPLAKMVKLTRDFMAQSDGKLYAQLVLAFRGDVFSAGKTSLDVPADIGEYIFLEASGLQPIRCARAEIPLLGGLVGPFSRQVVLTLEFDLPKGVSARLQAGRGEAKFVVGGLGFEDKVIRYGLPLAAITADAPVELQRLYERLGATGAP